ncbi:MAG: DUF1080 domain-containing protein [Pirellulaceae bacterium]|nr:DUF1080 domain-containing protein [Pirellulaceae bacterium]
MLLSGGLWTKLPGVWGQESTSKVPAAPKENADSAVNGKMPWKKLLAETGLEGWTATDFYKPGKVYRDGQLLVMEEGNPMTGITYQGKNFPTQNYEIEFQARRTSGNDFLCGLTFPVGKSYCSFIGGGWGGGVVGLSSVDGADASENQTSGYHEFKNQQWYTFRLAVDEEFIRGWIDDQEVFNQEREDHEFSTRIEVFACQPLGLCAYRSRVEIKNLRWRQLNDEAAAVGAGQ